MMSFSSWSFWDRRDAASSSFCRHSYRLEFNSAVSKSFFSIREEHFCLRPLTSCNTIWVSVSFFRSWSLRADSLGVFFYNYWTSLFSSAMVLVCSARACIFCEFSLIRPSFMTWCSFKLSVRVLWASIHWSLKAFFFSFRTWYEDSCFSLRSSYSF